MYSAAYALLLKRVALGKEINEGFDEVRSAIARQLREAETGMPSIAAMGFLPLNMDEWADDEGLPPELMGGGS